MPPREISISGYSFGAVHMFRVDPTIWIEEFVNNFGTVMPTLVHYGGSLHLTKRGPITYSTRAEITVHMRVGREPEMVTKLVEHDA